MLKWDAVSDKQPNVTSLNAYGVFRLDSCRANDLSTYKLDRHLFQYLLFNRKQEEVA